jgi:hypothetical protein
MKRDPRAFLADVIDAGHAISQAVQGIWGCPGFVDRSLGVTP